ncbi:MAG: sugar phosphate isomerase/epimerase [Clostridia bacterium]|nr:sugar phosphate isomerase/epimerase [Clostridia bacterium]
MYQAALCLGLSGTFGLPEAEQIRALRQIGFEGFFVNWTPGTDLSALRAVGDECGMIFQSVHAPFAKMADMWGKDEPKARIAIDELCTCLTDTAEAGVPIMIIHPFIGFEDHTPTEEGLRHYGEVIDLAETLGVKLAFENVEGEEYLAALMARFGDRACVGFCWDTGHEMCYNHSKDMLALYGDKLICTHINDNLGIRDYHGNITWIDDLHLLPFDGAGDWGGIVRRLNAHGYNGILTFELTRASKPDRHENDGYAAMEPIAYLTEAYKRACRVATMKLADAKNS